MLVDVKYCLCVENRTLEFNISKHLWDWGRQERWTGTDFRAVERIISNFDVLISVEHQRVVPFNQYPLGLSSARTLAFDRRNQWSDLSDSISCDPTWL